MRYWRVISNSHYINSLACECSKRRLSASSNSSYYDVNFFDTDYIRLLSNNLADFCGSERSPFLSARKSERSGRRPRYGISASIREQDFVLL